jgi:hypothetical protein
LIQQLYTLAENCNNVFWMDTTIDETIQEGLDDATLTKAKVNENGNVVLVSSDGFEIEMTSSKREYTADNYLQLQMSGTGDSSSTLMIDN